MAQLTMRRSESLSDLMKETNFGKNFNLPTCELHPNQAVLFWCVTDETQACQTCFETSHNGHSLQSYKKYLQNSVAERLVRDSANLERQRNEANHLLEKCDEQLETLSLEMDRYRKVMKELAIGKNLIDTCFKMNATHLSKFAKDIDYDISMHTITAFLELTENLEEFTSLIELKDTKILNYQGIKLTSRFMIVKTWASFEVKGSNVFTVGRNKFTFKCELPG